jgi:hypothetical protein
MKELNGKKQKRVYYLILNLLVLSVARLLEELRLVLNCYWLKPKTQVSKCVFFEDVILEYDVFRNLQREKQIYIHINHNNVLSRILSRFRIDTKDWS